VLGDFDQMDKSICLIFIKYTGWIPRQCDCTGVQEEGGGGGETQRRRRRRLVPSATKTTATVLDLQYHPNQDGHGVKTHASGYNVTEKQLDMINVLRNDDIKLHGMVKEIFKQQVVEVEQQYGISMCTTFRAR
jgi:hypothetical protein